MNIKEKIKESGVCQWEIAEALNVSEFTFSRWLRRPEKLEESKIKSINNALNNLKKIKSKTTLK